MDKEKVIKKVSEKSLEETATWAIAVVCFVLLFISIVIEKSIHAIGTWFKKNHKKELYEALEKVKAELMLLGFISLLLTVGQTPISSICISKKLASAMHPCSAAQLAEKAKKYNESKEYGGDGRLLFELTESYIPRRSLATKGYDKCADKGDVAFVSAYAMHQLHVFIFVLAVVHIIYCIVTYALGNTKMRTWKKWEDETKTIEYQYSNDPDRFRFARDTSFGRRHLNFWSKTNLTVWIVCFFRQFFGSVTKADYIALRHGFIAAHLAPGRETKYDFRDYIQRSLEEDFKTIVEISPVIWFAAVLFLLTNTSGIYSYFWLPFIPLLVVLVVGTKLQVIITKLCLRIEEKSNVVRGAPVVQVGDDLFWFSKPRFMLFLIHLVLFTNAFQLAFFVYTTYAFTLRNCFHEKTEDVIIRIVVGVVVQILCSYVTLPLYALVTQMGTTMKATVFKEGVATALKQWHDTAKKEMKHGRHSESNTPFSSRPTTPTRGSSPIHLLHNHNNRSSENFTNSPSPRYSDHHDHHYQFSDLESQQQKAESSSTHPEEKPVVASVELPVRRSKSLKDFSFK